MTLGILAVPGRPTILDQSSTRAYCACCTKRRAVHVRAKDKKKKKKKQHIRIVSLVKQVIGNLSIPHYCTSRKETSC